MRRLALWLLILAPIFLALRLVYLYSVDQRFLDDWVWAQDLVKWKEGKYAELFHDICSVHLEHRPMVPRALGFLITLALGGNTQGQNVLCFLWVTITFAALCFLWMRHGGLTLREGWLPLFLASALFYSPMQWQAFLWPICHETPMPVMFLLLSLLTAFTPWRWWLRSLVGTICAILAMLSFASGFLMWVLPLPVFLLCGSFAGTREKVRFVLLWGAVLFVTMLLYFQVDIKRQDSLTLEKTILSLPGSYRLTYDLHNEVSPQYAYGHGEENTMTGEVSYFVKHPELAAEFVATFCGAFLTRGLSADLKIAAQIAGWILITGWAWAAAYFWRNRHDFSLRRSLLPMLCLGAYTPLTGLMVAVGRAYAGGTGSALNGRYTIHQSAMLIALVGAGFFIIRHFRSKNPAPSRALFQPGPGLVFGVLAGIVGVGWVHGASMMWEWNGARWRGAAAQYLSQVFSRGNVFVSFIAGNHLIAKSNAADLDHYGLLRRGLAHDRKLSQFTIASKSPELIDDQGEFQRFYKNQAGEWRVQGYARLPGINRPADAVLLAYKNSEGAWIMFGFTQSWGPPFYLSRNLSKDEYAIIPGRDPWPQHMMCPFFPEIYLEEEPPASATITAWALDMKLKLLHRIPHRRDVMDDKGKRVTRSDGPDGSLLSELAKDDIDP